MNDGEPIADNNRDKVFKPFFTTRRESGGTGMGLEIARSMLRAHHGSINLSDTDDCVAFLLTCSKPPRYVRRESVLSTFESGAGAAEN